MMRAALPVAVLVGGLAAACGGDSHAPLAGSLGNGGSFRGGAPSSGGRASAGRAGTGGTDTGGSADDAGALDGGDAATPGAGGRGSTGGASGSGNLGGRSGSGGSNTTGGSNGSSGRTANGGSGGQGGSPDDGGRGPAGGALCEADPGDPVTAFGPVDATGPSTFARFGAISADELSVVWTSSSGDVYVGARAKKPGAFDSETKINGVALAVDRAAMEPTGLVVLAVAKDRASLVEFRRLNRSDPFASAAGTELSRVHTFLVEGGAVSEPVLGADKLSLFFLATKSGQAPNLYESKWDTADGLWAAPSELTNPALASPDVAHPCRATGASADGRTLFFYDTSKTIERAAFRNSPGAPFDTFVDVGAFPDAAPNARCDTFYYTGRDASGPALFTGG